MLNLLTNRNIGAKQSISSIKCESQKNQDEFYELICKWDQFYNKTDTYNDNCDDIRNDDDEVFPDPLIP